MLLHIFWSVFADFVQEQETEFAKIIKFSESFLFYYVQMYLKAMEVDISDLWHTCSN